jgi:integrase
MKLTARNIFTLPARGDTRVDYVDEILPGFGLRVSPTGTRAFTVTYSQNGKVRRYTIGRTPPLSLADARDIARRIQADAVKGADPQAEKIAARKKLSQGMLSFGELCERFLSEAKTRDNLPLRPTTLYNWRNIVKAEILPALGGWAPEDITRRDVRDLVEGLAEEHPYWANRVFEVIRRVFSWALEKELLAASPCVGLKKPGGEKARDRVLSSEEIRSVWAGLENEARVGDAIRLLFYTAARPREMLQASWPELDLEERMWRVPSDRMKGRQPHSVPLSTSAMAILFGLGPGAGSQWLFPSPTTTGRLVTVAKALRRIRQRTGVSFQLRDIRRTVRTRLREMGVLQDVSEAILSHTPPRLVRTYDRYEPIPEMRAALEAWGARLHGILAGEVPRAEMGPVTTA